MDQFPEINTTATAFLTGFLLDKTSPFQSAVLSVATDTGACSVLELDPDPTSKLPESTVWDKVFLMEKSLTDFTISTKVDGLTLTLSGMTLDVAKSTVEQHSKEQGWASTAQAETQRGRNIEQERITQVVQEKAAARDADRR